MKRTTPTTTLSVARRTEYTSLEEKYQLIRYELPKDLYWRARNVPSIYGQLHNTLRDQLDCPYKAYMYDMLDGGEKWVVYALYPQDATPVSLELPFASTHPLSAKKIAFKDLAFHILLKLLQITYVRGHQTTRFVGQDQCYIYAKKFGEFAHVCLRVDLKGDIRTQLTDPVQEFKVNGHACLFRQTKYPQGSLTPYMYFGRKITKKSVYFLHLKRKEIQAAAQREEPVYQIGTRKNRKTTLVYHSLSKLEASVGKLIADFIGEFVTFLAGYGIVCQSKMRTFTRFVPPKEGTQLPLSHLGTVAVYDNRLNRMLPLHAYLDIFEGLCPEVCYVELQDIAAWTKGPVLVLQDYDAKSFKEGKPLEGQIDPHEVLYKVTSPIPKQSLNINGLREEIIEEEEDDEDTDEDSEEGEEQEEKSIDAVSYLTYDLPKTDSKTLKLKLKVALAQLYMKEGICAQKSVEQWFPLISTEFLYVRKARYVVGHDPYITALYFEDDKLCFLDLRDPEQKDQLRTHCKQLGVDWRMMEDQLLRKHKKRADGEPDQELTHYDLIIGPGLFVELEDAEERVLYNYAEIERRQREMKQKKPVSEFKLLARYDTIRPIAKTLPLGEMRSRSLLQSGVQPQNEKEAQSLTFYRKLQAYDAFLDEIQQSHATISFKDLSKDEFKEHIMYIFQKGKRSRRQLIAYYQKFGWFLSDKGNDVQMYEGIWYDDEHHYMVGSAQPMNRKQVRGHVIRHFDVYQGADTFAIGPFLRAMSVQFVRHNQYTVYPYPFHLIDVYVENILRYQ